MIICPVWPPIFSHKLCKLQSIKQFSLVGTEGGVHYDVACYSFASHCDENNKHFTLISRKGTTSQNFPSCTIS